MKKIHPTATTHNEYVIPSTFYIYVHAHSAFISFLVLLLISGLPSTRSSRSIFFTQPAVWPIILMQNAQTMFTIFTMVSIATMRDTMQHGDEEKGKKRTAHIVSFAMHLKECGPDSSCL